MEPATEWPQTGSGVINNEEFGGIFQLIWLFFRAVWRVSLRAGFVRTRAWAGNPFQASPRPLIAYLKWHFLFRSFIFNNISSVWPITINQFIPTLLTHPWTIRLSFIHWNDWKLVRIYMKMSKLYKIYYNSTQIAQHKNDFRFGIYFPG